VNPKGLTGIALSVVLALLGAWTLFSPFMTAHQDAALAWTAATRSDVWTGAVLLLLSAVSVLVSAPRTSAGWNVPPAPAVTGMPT